MQSLLVVTAEGVLRDPRVHDNVLLAAGALSMFVNSVSQSDHTRTISCKREESVLQLMVSQATL